MRTFSFIVLDARMRLGGRQKTWTHAWSWLRYQTNSPPPSLSTAWEMAAVMRSSVHPGVEPCASCASGGDVSPGASSGGDDGLERRDLRDLRPELVVRAVQTSRRGRSTQVQRKT